MKKIVLSLAGVLAATAFAPEASAIPAFSRQVGMACQACHFQHFPQLNSFGRAFKSSGFTMMGAQAKVEGDHLSIPATLNMSILVTAGYERISNQATPATPAVPAPIPPATAPAAAPGTPATTNGKFFFPNGGGELSLFVAGRVSENIGFLTELAGTIGGSPFKLPMLWDVGGVKAGLVLVTGNAPAWSFETLNTGAVSTHRMMGNAGPNKEHINVTGAAQYLGTGAAKGHGISAVVNGDMGFVNIGKYDLTGAMGAGSFTNAMSTTYVRGAYIFNAGGWDSAVGIQSFSGSVGSPVLGAVAQDSKATIIDGQMQGEVGGMPLGLYASYGRAPVGNAATGNVYNAGALGAAALGAVGMNDRKSFNIAAELGVIPHKATLQLALRSAKNGSGNAGAAAGIGDKDNAVMIGGVYELAQNVGLYLTHTAQSGSAWNTPNAAGVLAGLPATVVGKNVTSFTLEANF